MFKNEEYSSLLKIFTENQIYNLNNLQILNPYALPVRRH